MSPILATASFTTGVHSGLRLLSWLLAQVSAMPPLFGIPYQQPRIRSFKISVESLSTFAARCGQEITLRHRLRTPSLSGQCHLHIYSHQIRRRRRLVHHPHNLVV